MGLAVLSMLFAHMIGDYYLQSDALVEGKTNSKGKLLIHGGLCAGAALVSVWLIAGVGFLPASLVAAGTFVLHVLIDGGVRPAANKRLGTWPGYCLDQLLHIIVCVGLGVALSNLAQTEHPFLTWSGEGLAFFAGLSSFVMVGRLAEITVRKLLDSMRDGASFDLGGENSDIPEGAGRLIGVLERVIIVTLTLLGEYSAIAFVITAKSIARFKRLETEPGFAEQYLVGTLASVALALGGSISFTLLATGGAAPM